MSTVRTRASATALLIVVIASIVGVLEHRMLNGGAERPVHAMFTGHQANGVEERAMAEPVFGGAHAFPGGRFRRGSELAARAWLDLRQHRFAGKTQAWSVAAVVATDRSHRNVTAGASVLRL